jgi:hypothetical protein
MTDGHGTHTRTRPRSHRGDRAGHLPTEAPLAGDGWVAAKDLTIDPVLRGAVRLLAVALAREAFAASAEEATDG